MGRLIDADRLIAELQELDFVRDAKRMNVNKFDEELKGFYIGYTMGLIILQPTVEFNVEEKAV